VKLRHIRETLGLSIKEVAAEAGLHPQSIRNIECGVRKKGWRSSREKIAQVFDQPVESIFPDKIRQRG
jgi:transcriptional regulator with XRE-family HTH domain